MVGGLAFTVIEIGDREGNTGDRNGKGETSDNLHMLKSWKLFFLLITTSIVVETVDFIVCRCMPGYA